MKRHKFGFLFLLFMVECFNFGTNSCIVELKSVLNRNGPELTIISQPLSQESKYVSKIKIRIDWKHIQILLLPHCIRMFLIQYRFALDKDMGTHKIERISHSAHISDPIEANATHYIVELPETCKVNFVL